MKIAKIGCYQVGFVSATWSHVVDTELPDCIRDKLPASEAVKIYCRTSADVAACVAAYQKLAGVGPKSVAALLNDAGWTAGFVRMEAA